MKFGMACLIQLGRFWKTNTINETTAKLSVLESVSDDVSFEFIQVVTDLITAAVYADRSNNIDDFDPLDVPDVVLNDSELLKNIFTEFMQSMPQPEGKKIPTSKKKVGTIQNKK